MRLLNIVFVILLWSCLARPTVIQPFQVVEGYQEVPDSKIEVRNMPRYRSQDSLPICYAMSSTVLAQHYYCERKKIEKCSEIDPKLEISPFSMAGWVDEPEEKGSIKDASTGNGTAVVGKNINLFVDGTPAITLSNSLDGFIFQAESCYAFDKVANKYGNNEDLLNTMLIRLEVIYENARNDTQACLSCLVEAINNDWETKINVNGLRDALNKKTFGEFVYASIFQNCKDFVLPRPIPRVGFFPRGEKNVTNNEVLSKAKEILKSQIPLQMGRICVLRNPDQSCEETHSLVISGYKEVKKGNSTRPLFKVQNSWGKEWQDQFNDGWIDAESLLANIDEPKKGEGVSPGLLSWLE